MKFIKWIILAVITILLLCHIINEFIATIHRFKANIGRINIVTHRAAIAAKNVIRIL